MLVSSGSGGSGTARRAARAAAVSFAARLPGYVAPSPFSKVNPPSHWSDVFARHEPLHELAHSAGPVLGTAESTHTHTRTYNLE